MPATAATRAPSGAVSVPLPRTPSENMRSNTVGVINIFLKKNRGTEGGCLGDVRVAMKALAVVWHVRWESASGGLTPSSVRRYRKTIEGWQGPKRNTAWYACRHLSSSSRAQLAGSGQDGHC